MRISEQTFYRWKNRYGVLMPMLVRRLRQLEEENAPLGYFVADFLPNKEMKSKVIRETNLGPARRREAV